MKRLAGTCFVAAGALVAACHCPTPVVQPCPCAASAPASSAPPPAKPPVEQCADNVAEPKVYEMETVEDTGVVRLFADGFVDLPVRDRLLAYWLSRAAVAGEPIAWDQRSRYGLALKELVEELTLHAAAIDPAVRPRIEVFAKKVWINKGIYEGWSQRKMAPAFSRKELADAAHAALKHGAKLKGVANGADLDKHLASLDKILFDPKFEPEGVSKSPPAGKDIITASAGTYYDGITLKELSGYKEAHPLNSRLVKKGKGVEELVYRAKGTGLYGPELTAMAEALRQALPYASESQRKSLEPLVAYFENGEHEEFRRYSKLWVKDDPAVDAVLGFIEEYGDPRGIHGEYEGMVFAVDKARSAVMKKVASEAAYFEARMPWLDAYKRTEFKPPIANAVLTLTLSGGAAPVTPVGINLPNEQDIRQEHGSKNFYLSSVDDAAGAVQGKAVAQHLMPAAHRGEFARCQPSIYPAAVALHEITGHGSGKVSPTLKQDPKAALGPYGSTLEEARAELVALHIFWDPKAREIGLIPDEGCAKMAAQSYPSRLLMRLRVIQTGDKIEEDHIRAQSLIVRFAMDRGAVKEQWADGHVYLEVTDYDAWRKSVDTLLAELMRIKAEGDQPKAKELIEKFGVRFDPKWRDDVVTRLKSAGVPLHFAFVAPRLKGLVNEKGEVTDATIVDSLSLVETALIDAGKKQMP
jgi:dipeptidyl-peptidase III